MEKDGTDPKELFSISLGGGSFTEDQENGRWDRRNLASGARADRLIRGPKRPNLLYWKVVFGFRYPSC